jgi:heme/copper-type cytochrome/quinol oxidase subunit 2
LAELLFWMALACCVVAQIAIVRATLRVPVRNEETTVPHPRRLTEVAWTVLPAIVLAMVLIATWYAIQAHGAGPAAPAPHFRLEHVL